jgi:hypothetical protein
VVGAGSGYGAVCEGVALDDNGRLAHDLRRTLDDPSSACPKIDIFVRDRPPRAILPPGLVTFETIPG